MILNSVNIKKCKLFFVIEYLYQKDYYHVFFFFDASIMFFHISLLYKLIKPKKHLIDGAEIISNYRMAMINQFISRSRLEGLNLYICEKRNNCRFY